MAAVRFPLYRLEGRVTLYQADDGALRLEGARLRGLEALLLGRSPQDAVFLVQRLSADTGVSHALASVMAWENAGGTGVSHNGALLRDLLHALSWAHAHLRQFYQQALPDYIPPAALSGYRGAQEALRRVAAGFGQRPEARWAAVGFPHPFSAAEVERLWANALRVQRALGLLQRMMAVVGGKYPVVMSLVPGGVTAAISRETVFRLQTHLREVRALLGDAPFEDGRLVVRRHQELLEGGRGPRGLISAGTLGDEAGPGASLFPSGVFLGEKLEPFRGAITESVHAAYYDLPSRETARGLLQPAPDKPGAHSWIKAPRYQEQVVETGAVARLAITHLSGARSEWAQEVAAVENALGMRIRQANTTAGRLLARLAEVPLLLQRCEQALHQLAPGNPAVAENARDLPAEGEGRAALESPAGTLVHRLALERGRIAYYDIVSASTWNGSPADARGAAGAIEVALNRAPPDLATAEGRRAASRIVHSFFFSAADAAQ